MRPSLYVDLRCLQDSNYRVRGIGQHVTALLRTRSRSDFSSWKAVGLTDPNSPAAPEEIASLVDEVIAAANPCLDGAPAVFIDGTPMTHDTRFGLRFQSHPAFLRAAVVYDFIPLEWPGYLPGLARRIDYLAKMARLRKFDQFFPISEYTAWRLSELLGVSRDRVHVTGASVRRSLYELNARLIAPSPSVQRDPYFVVVVAADVRKNPEVAVEAVRRLNLIYSGRIALKVVGHYDDAYKRNLLRLAGHPEGAGFLEFCPEISDEQLVSLFAGALAAIAPSYMEGFSLPVVEASVSNCPVMASTCAAHLELIEQTEALFPPDDAAVLSEKLQALLTAPSLRDSLVRAQQHLAAKFHEEAVGNRFWSALGEAFENCPTNAFIGQKQKPLLAFLSPYPPDESGVALYTAMTMRAGERLFCSDLYTEASRPLTFEGNFRDAGRVSIAPLLDGRYNAVISVLGNSCFHTRIFDVFERYGGPCILHDGRLVQIYCQRLGVEGFMKLASRLVGRTVSTEEVAVWLQDRNLPSLFLEPIIDRASPLIVHTARQSAELKERYGVDAHVTTCCPNHFFCDSELTRSAREAARQRLGMPSNALLVSSFGIVHRVKAIESCVVAIELLRSWNIPAELYFVGGAGIETRQKLEALATLYGISEHIHCFTDFVDEQTYRDFLIASNGALQLRTYGFGQLSAALTDCISAGLPCVANDDLAISCDAPDYVLTVPDRFSPLQIAEQLALIWEGRGKSDDYRDARAAYLETHNFEYYGKRLIEILGIA